MQEPNTDDLREVLSVTNIPPEEAAKNIDRANLFDVPPDTYKQLKTHLDPQAEAMERVPANLEPEVIEMAKESQQTAAVMKEDLPKLNFFTRRMKYYPNKLKEIPSVTRELSDLGNKFIDQGGVLDEGDELRTQTSMQYLNELQSENFDVDGGLENLLLDAAVAGTDMAKALWENKETAGAIAALGTVGGGVGGAILGIPAGPAGIAAGARFGAQQGFRASIPYGVGAALAFDGYKRMRGDIVNELRYFKDEQGNPLTQEKNRIINIAKGTATLSAMAEFGAGKILAKGLPQLKRFKSPKLVTKFLKENPTAMANMEVIGNVLSASAAEGGQEAFSEFVQTLGTEFGKMDESDASFLEALNRTATSENFKKFAYSGTVGAVVGGGVSAVGNVAGRQGLIKQYEQIQGVLQRKQNVLDNKSSILEGAMSLQDTKMNQVAPGKLKELTDKVFTSMAGGEYVNFYLDDFRKFSNTPEKAQAIRNKIDPEGNMTRMAQELDVAIPMKKADVLELAMKYPEIADYMRVEADSQNALEVTEDFKNVADKIKNAESMREELLSTLGIDETLTPEQEAKILEAAEPVKSSNYFEDQNDYLDSVSFTEVEGMMTKEEAEVFNTKQLDARLEIANQVKDTVDNQFESASQQMFQDLNEVDIQEQLQKYDRELTIVDSFQVKDDKSEAATLITMNHKKKGFSPSAIDPRSLTEDLREIYLNDPILKKRKVFVEGGVNIQESAFMNGVENPTQLLEILKTTPTRQQFRTERQGREALIKNEVDQLFVEDRKKSRDEAFSGHTNLMIKEMEFLKNKEWNTVKRGVIKITSPVPKAKEVNAEAKATVAKMKVAELNPTRFKAAESRTQRAATKNFLNGEIEAAFDNKKKSIFNNELRKETINAKEKVIKFQNFWKKVNSKSNQAALKESGLLEAMQDYTSLYRLDGSNRGVKEKNGFTNFVLKQAQLGNMIPATPDNPLDVTQSARDLTVEQYEAITDMGVYILDMAKKKNKFVSDLNKLEELRTAEIAAQKIEELTEAHPQYDPERIIKEKNNKEWSNEKKLLNDVARVSRTGLSYFSNIKSVSMELDNYKLDGFFEKTINAPLTEKRTSKRLELQEIQKIDKAIKEKHYTQKEFDSLYLDDVYVKEFENIRDLGDGRGNVKKAELMILQASLGDPEGRASIENFKREDKSSLTVEDLQNVLERELDVRDADFVQEFYVNRWNRFTKRSFDLHERTTGTRPEMVEGVSFVHRGIERKGGYFPMKRQILRTDIKDVDIQRIKEDSTLSEQPFYARMRSAEQTKQGRLKDRTGSERAIDINPDNFIEFTEEFVHDLHFRETGIDVLKILKNPKNAENMKAVIGTEEYATLVNNVKDVISKVSERETTLFADKNKWFNSVLNKANSVHAIGVLAYNMGSMAMQPLSLLNLLLRVSPKTGVYLGKQMIKIAKNPIHYLDMLEVAGKILKDIGLEQDNIDAALVKQSYEWKPGSPSFLGKLAGYAGLSNQSSLRFQRFMKGINDFGFEGLRKLDQANKVIAVHALSEQFFNGDIPGYSLKKIKKMTDAEKAQTLSRVVKQAIDLTLTDVSPEGKSALEKTTLAPVFVRFFTDRRAIINTYGAQAKQIRNNIKDGNYRQGASQALLLAGVVGLSKAWIDSVRGDDESLLKKALEAEDSEDVKSLLVDIAWTVPNAFAELPSLLPGVDSASWLWNQLDRSESAKRSYRSVSTPAMNVASDIVYGAQAINQALVGFLTGEGNDLTPLQRKEVLKTMGYIAGGAPTGAITKAIKAIDEMDTDDYTKQATRVIKDTHKVIDFFIDEFKNKPEAELFIEDLKEYKQSLPQFDADVRNIIPEDSQEIIKQISSEGKWDAYDKETGASGVYQFTEQRWNEIASTNPELGLTENGRVSKDTAQQEKAMKWAIQDNTRGLMAYEIPVTTENLLGAHKFGFDNFVTIYNADNNSKLSKILGKDVDNPLLKKYDTVKGIKAYLSREVNKTK